MAVVICVHLPRFELVTAAGGPAALSGRPLALAPLPGHAQRIGETSGAAEAFGVRPGMELSEALARCPRLGLVAPDPLGAVEAWDRVADALEGIGARPELERPGVAYVSADGLLGLYRGLDGVLAAVRRAVARPVRLGVGPTRLCALAASRRARARRAVSVDGDPRRWLAPLPVALLRSRAATEHLVEPLERLGLRTLGDVAALPRAAVSDRFGDPGALARRLARGEDTPLHPRQAGERVEEALELPDALSGAMLERAADLLVDRVLARPERRGRTLRAVVLAARLVEGGTWRERVVLREAVADARRVRLALGLRLALLPAPALALSLAVERFGPGGGDQREMFDDRALRRERLGRAVAQVRALAGPDAALRALPLDPGSRVPERRMMLTPFPM